MFILKSKCIPYNDLCTAVLAIVLSSCFTSARSQSTQQPGANLFTALESSWLQLDQGLSRGAAWGDMDGDGYPELYVSNSQGQANFLYKNRGGELLKLQQEVGSNFLESVTYGGSSEGVNWVDYDNDGDLDLYIASRGREENLLFKNDDLKGFIKVQDHPLTASDLSSSMACWADIEGDGDLDVLLVGYRHNGNFVFENLGRGSFKRRDDHVLSAGEGRGRNCSCGDANNDGLPEFFIANGRTRNEFYANKGNWNFEPLTEGLLVADLGYAYGSSWADYDNDGDLDILLTNFDKENFLFENDGNGNFEPLMEGALSGNQGGASKGQSWGDYDNDGDIDLFVGNGTYGPDMYNFLYLNDGEGDFDKIMGGVVTQHADTSAAVASADFDRDGDLDVFVANWGANDPNRFYINDTRNTNWITFRLRGADSNSHGIGAMVQLEAMAANGETSSQYRWMYPVTGYGGQNDLEIHFGLGEMSRIRTVKVYWPSGNEDIFAEPAINRHYLLEEEGTITEIK